MIPNRNLEMDFRLQTMEDIYDLANGETDIAHRHDYYTVLLVEDAIGMHTIDYTKFPFGKSEVHFVSTGQVHQIQLEQRPIGSVITFTQSFLMESGIPEDFITNINLFQNFGHSPPLKLDGTTFHLLNRITKEMSTCLSTDLYYGHRAAGALLQLFLIYCSNSTQLDAAQLDTENAAICIHRAFKQLVEERFTHWHKVQEYAAELHISRKHLSQTIKKITGKVAKEHIQDRLTLEAKRLLLHTSLPISQVGYEIGFEEPLYFSAFFKKRVGVSPSRFRAVR
ncbi:MAG: AraC family transcriptional regulator [Saprospiraceae bacterium]|nr:AraC family transcriptional regulator [Saprospiraceae bacterium]